MSDLVGNPEKILSRDAAHMSFRLDAMFILLICRYAAPMQESKLDHGFVQNE